LCLCVKVDGRLTGGPLGEDPATKTSRTCDAFFHEAIPSVYQQKSDFFIYFFAGPDRARATPNQLTDTDWGLWRGENKGRGLTFAVGNGGRGLPSILLN